MAMLSPKFFHGFAAMAFTASHGSLHRTYRCVKIAPILLLLNTYSSRHYNCFAQKSSRWLQTKRYMSLAWRLVHLAIIFLPSVLTLPMCLLGPLRRTGCGCLPGASSKQE